MAAASKTSGSTRLWPKKKKSSFLAEAERVEKGHKVYLATLESQEQTSLSA